jgi:hypothetical protein
MTVPPRPVTSEPDLGPVVTAAMSDLTKWVYDSHDTGFFRPRHLTRHLHLDDPVGSGRAAAVATFKTLKHHQISWDTYAICTWAQKHGWLGRDNDQLRTFAGGIGTDIRFLAGPDPFSHVFVRHWLSGRSACVENSGTPIIRRRRCCTVPPRKPHSRAVRIAPFHIPHLRAGGPL